ncbi:MAG: hypothetical protein ACLUI3_07135 [Christensenellales bacterium]
MIESMQASPVARVIISISAMLFAGFRNDANHQAIPPAQCDGLYSGGHLMGRAA